MLIHLAILHVVALIIKGACAVPSSNINSPQGGKLRMYELFNEYLKDREQQNEVGQKVYPSHISDLGTDKRGKYSWSVAYGKRDRWIAYGKRNSNHRGLNIPTAERFAPPVEATRDLSIYNNNEVKRQQAWRTRWGKKRTTVSSHPTTKAMNNYDDSDQSYEGYFTKNPIFKRQQWTKFPWGKRSY